MTSKREENNAIQVCVYGMVQHLISPCDINFQHGCTCRFRNLVTCNTIQMVDCTMCVYIAVCCRVTHTRQGCEKYFTHRPKNHFEWQKLLHAFMGEEGECEEVFTWWRFWIVRRFIFKWYIVCAWHLTKSAISLPSNNYCKCDRKWKFSCCCPGCHRNHHCRGGAMQT